MSGKDSSKRSKAWLCAVAAVTFFAMANARASAAPVEITLGDGGDATWPAFSDVLNDACPPPPPDYSTPGWIPNDLLSNSSVVGSAPLPPAVVTGLFMLGGNWVITRMWKKRKI
jgi:hypothetical protein